jgi:hypothetical protein
MCCHIGGAAAIAELEDVSAQSRACDCSDRFVRGPVPSCSSFFAFVFFKPDGWGLIIDELNYALVAVKDPDRLLVDDNAFAIDDAHMRLFHRDIQAGKIFHGSLSSANDGSDLIGLRKRATVHCSMLKKSEPFRHWKNKGLDRCHCVGTKCSTTHLCKA